MRFWLLALLAITNFLIINESYAQKASKGKQSRYDSVRVKAGHFFVIEKDAYYAANDTVFVLPDTLNYYQKKHHLNQSNKFYNSLVEKLSNKKYSNLLYKLIFEKEEERQAKQKAEEATSFEKSRLRYNQYNGHQIGSINLKKLKVFGTNVDDTTKLETSLITRTINKLHFDTRDKIIQHNLLVENGSKINAIELADNERLIRQLDYIKDARIYVREPQGSDAANLYVVTRDVFPLKFDYTTDDETNNSSIGISNINLFGTGHELENNLVINDPGESTFGYDGYYRVRNIQGTFITGELNYVSTFRSKGIGVKAFRPFYTPDVLHAGGVEISHKEHNQLRAYDNVSDSIITIHHRENLQDVWFARSFKAIHLPAILKQRERLRFIVSGRITKRFFHDRPEVRTDMNEAFHRRTNILFSAGLSSRGYYKDRLIRNFGRTEDIPVGTSIQLTSGMQFGEFFNRNYLGLEFSEGDVIQKFGYLKGKFRLGGFFRKGNLEQGVFNLGTEYFSKLYNFNLYRLRQFVTIDYIKGIRRKSQDFININDTNGITGLYNFYLTGTERFFVKTESVLFTPFFLGGFRTAFLGFFDLAVINSDRAGDVYYGAGFGLRLKNDNLAFNTIQLRLGFYPSLPFEPASTGFSFSTVGNLGLRDFDISRPKIVRFR
ncbi:MAG: hypothetical protein JXQ96_05235 [Cyclobacteriaceae bacterium]